MHVHRLLFSEEGEERDDLAIEYDQRDLLRDRNLTESINNVKSVAYKQCFKAIRYEENYSDSLGIFHYTPFAHHNIKAPL